MDYLNRTTASMLGFAIGDALGATTEFMSQDDIQIKYGVLRDIVGGGWLELEPGDITDDTEMMLCVARSLVECSGYNAKDIADRLVDWWQDDPVDVGSACRRGLYLYAKSGILQRKRDDEVAGNGAVMRILPFILTGMDESAAMEHGRLTHNSDLSDRAVRYYMKTVDWALEGEGKNRIWQMIDHSIKFRPEYYERRGKKSGGYVVETMSAVFYAFMETETFEECLIMTANMGGDTDTISALAGGLAGAFYGLEAIPARWLNGLNQSIKTEIEHLTSRFEETYNHGVPYSDYDEVCGVCGLSSGAHAYSDHQCPYKQGEMKYPTENMTFFEPTGTYSRIVHGKASRVDKTLKSADLRG